MNVILSALGVVVIVIVLVLVPRASGSSGPPTGAWWSGSASTTATPSPGFHLIIPLIERMFQVDVREMLVEAQPQMIITNDNLNAQVDAQVYLKVKADEENVKASQYNVTNYEYQIVNLARTTLRNIIGTLTLKSANSERGKINAELRSTLTVGDRQLGHRDPAHRAQGDRPAGGRPGDHEQGGQGREREGGGHRLRHRDRDPGRRSAPGRDQEGRGHQAGPDPRTPRARPRPSSWSTRPPTSTSSATPRCCGSWKPWRRRSGQNAKIVVPANAQLINVIGELAGVVPVPVPESKPNPTPGQPAGGSAGMARRR